MFKRAKHPRAAKAFLALAALLTLLGAIQAPGFYVFATFSAFVALIYMLGGGSNIRPIGTPPMGSFGYESQFRYGSQNHTT